jgi:hypothetical protein
VRQRGLKKVAAKPRRLITTFITARGKVMSWGAAVGFMLIVVVLPFIVNEVGVLAPWLAEHLLRWGAKLLGSREATERYAEDWLANLEHVPGQITKLAWARGLLLLSIPQLR